MPLKFKRIFAALLCLLLLPAASALAVDVDRASSLTIHYSPYGIDATGAQFRLYKVADVDEMGKYALTGDFADYSIDVSHMNTENIHDLANTLQTYVQRDNPEPTAVGTIAPGNELCFKDLPVGLYLALGTPFQQGRYTYYAYPVLAGLPTNNEYDIGASPKFERESMTVYHEPDKIDISVLKLWQDEGHEDKRPLEITVQLLRDGEVLYTALLNAENNWRHEWKNLIEDHEWAVAEETVPQGYTVSYAREGDTFAITNTLIPVTPSGGHGNGDSWEENGLARPDTYSGRYFPDRLPQTGLLWWPVSALAAGGLLLFSVGYVMERKRDKDDED